MLWRRGRDSNPRWVLAHTRFPGVRLKPLIHLSCKPAIITYRGVLQETFGQLLVRQSSAPRQSS